MNLVVKVDIKTADMREYVKLNRRAMKGDRKSRQAATDRLADVLQNLLEKSIKVELERDTNEP